jgi:hypothetical protein
MNYTEVDVFVTIKLGDDAMRRASRFINTAFTGCPAVPLESRRSPDLQAAHHHLHASWTTTIPVRVYEDGHFSRGPEAKP